MMVGISAKPQFITPVAVRSPQLATSAYVSSTNSQFIGNNGYASPLIAAGAGGILPYSNPIVAPYTAAAFPSPYTAASYAPYSSATYATAPYVASPYSAAPYVASPYSAAPFIASPYTSAQYAAAPFAAGAYAAGTYAAAPLQYQSLPFAAAAAYRYASPYSTSAVAPIVL